MLGRTFGDFRIREKLGAGGAGDVYLADQVTLDREAVIKVITATPREGTSAAERFLREARLASQLDHPFAAHVYGFGTEADGTMWIAMELVRGVSLFELISQSGPIALARFVPFFERLCEVLQAAHEQGIIHRDIKPHNVMVLSRAGRMLPKLLDLGVARRGEAHSVLGAPQAMPTALPEALKLVEAETLELTMDGMIIGTPHYMSPEQFTHADRVDARSDLYSLTVLAYHALAGQVPFVGTENLFQLARLHMKSPLPALPDALPTALNDVIAKGTAKSPDARFQTANELGLALRAASGIGVDGTSLPQLDASLHDALVNDAPQPIAEAVALLDSARSPRQALDAVRTLHQVFARYLGVLALAARGRIGAGGHKDSSEVTELIGQLATSSLSDAQWIALCRELCRPWALRRAAHSIPELVAFFFAEDGSRGEGDATLALFAELELPAAGASDVQMHEALMLLVRRVGAVLQKASFLMDYALLVHRQDNERWMGTRRTRRATQELRQEAPAGAFLADEVGVPVLTLAPLVQAEHPSGGMPEELFFLAGAGRHGARMVAVPGSFELQSEEVWPWFSRAIIDVQTKRDQAQQDEKPPYKGLSTFTAGDADNYYGREREAEQFANRLREARFLAVVGPSGAGKSSFVLAGVLPLLPEGVRPVVMRPGSNPLARLGALDLRGDVLLVVDQFEELVTLCADGAERTAFAHALVQLPRVVVTLRDDFLIKIQQIEAMRERLSSSLQLIATPAADDLERVITLPAKRVGYAFDDPDLPRKMVQAVAEYPGALALLSFTASQLWELRDRQLRQMRGKTYEALGGVGGALAHHAEATLAAMSDDERSLVREMFRHLVTTQGTRAVVNRREMMELLGDTSVSRSALEKLVTARLLVTSESPDGNDRIEVIHEALIVSWPRLKEWLREDAETSRFLETLRASARQWEQRGRPSGLLWRKETLAEYKVWRLRYRGALTQSEDAFARASLRDETRTRRVRQGLGAAAVLALVVALVLIFRAYQEATNRLLALREEQARVALVDERPLEALAYLDAAVAGGAKGERLDAMAGVIDYELQGSQGVLIQHPLAPYRMVLNSDQSTVALITDDPFITIASVTDRDSHFRVPLESTCYSGAFTKDAMQFVAGCADGHLRVIDVGQRRVTHKIKIADDAVIEVAIAASGRSAIASAHHGGAVRVDLASGEAVPVFADKSVPWLSFRLSPDEHVVVLLSSPQLEVLPNTLRGLVIVRGNVQTRLTTEAPVEGGVFSPSGDVFAFTTRDGELGLLDVASGKRIWQREAHAKSINHVTFSPDGRTIATVGADAVVTWSRDGKRQWTAPARRALGYLCWSPDGVLLFTGGEDSAVLALQARTGEILWRHHGHSAATVACSVANAGKTLLSVGVDGSVRAWDASKGTVENAPVHEAVREVNVSWASDSPAFVTGSGLWIWEGDHVRQLLPIRVDAEQATTVAQSASGPVSFIVGNRLSLVEPQSGKVLATRDLPGPPLASLISDDASRLAVLLSGDSIEIVHFDGRANSRISAPGDSLMFAAFVMNHDLVTCSGSGLLSVWDATDGRLLNKTRAHDSWCYADIQDQVIRSYSFSEGGIRLWRWDGRSLISSGGLNTEFATEMLGRWQSDALTSSGKWVYLGPNGLTLAALHLRQAGFFRSSAGRSSFVFVDKNQTLARFAAPSRVDAAMVGRLQKSRGSWDLVEGRLTKRAKLD